MCGKCQTSSAIMISFLFFAITGNFRLLAAQPGLGCIEELAIPKYPRLARQARLQGVVEVRFEPKDPLVPETTIISNVALLRNAVVAAIATSRFRESCVDTEFKIMFSFEIDLAAPPRADDDGTVIIRWPGTIIIRARRFPLSG
jgi:hypothetical protein